MRDAPDPLAGSRSQAFVPPEMAGVGTVLRTLIPLLVSIAGAATVLLVRESVADDGTGVVIGAAVRAAVAVLLVVAAVVAWVRYRDRIRRSIRAFIEEGRAVTQQQRAQHRTST